MNSKEHFNTVGEEGLRGKIGESAYHNYANYVLRVVNPPKGSSLLDLGCGDGKMLRTIATMRPDLQLIGWDFADVKIAQAIAEAKDVTNVIYEVVDLKSEIPAGSQADNAYTFSVIQYFTPNEFGRLNRDVAKRRLSSAASIHHLSIPDLIKRPLLFQTDWLDRGQKSFTASVVHMLRMLAMDAKRRLINDLHYGDSYFHDADNLLRLSKEEFEGLVNRPSDSWYRFDIHLTRKAIEEHANHL